MRNIVYFLLCLLIIGCQQQYSVPDLTAPAGGNPPIFLIDETDSMRVLDRDGNPVMDEDVRLDAVKILNTVARAITVESSGVFEWTGDIPPNARLAVLLGQGPAPAGVFEESTVPPIRRYGASEGTSGEGLKFSLFVNGNAIFEMEVAEEDLSTWNPVEIDLAEYSGEDVRLTFAIEGVIVGPQLGYWGHPEILSPRQNPRQIILLGLDTLAAGHVGWMGYERDTTHYLDELSERSTIFMDAHSPSPWTLPSFAAVLSGRLPGVTGADRRNRGLSSNEDMIAENFRRNGFATAGFVNIPHLQEAGFFQGIDHQWEVHDFPAGRALLQARNWIEYHRDQEFFVFIHLFDPHIPYEPTAKWVEEFCDPEYQGPHPFKWDLQATLVTQNHLDPVVWAAFSDTEKRQCEDLYDAEIGTMDDALGGFLGWYDGENMLDNSLMIVFADHGEEFGEHDRWEHGHSQYEEQLHVPLLFKMPGQIQSRRVEGLVGTIDIYQTVMDLFDFTPENESFGESLVDILNGGNPDPDRQVISESTLWGPELKAIVTNDYKYIINMRSGAEELYNLLDDPGETLNLIVEEADVSSELRDTLEAYVTENISGWHLRFLPGPEDPISVDVTVTSNAEFIEPVLVEQIFSGSGAGLTVTGPFEIQVALDMAPGDSVELRFATNPSPATVTFSGTIDGIPVRDSIILGAFDRTLPQLIESLAANGQHVDDIPDTNELTLSTDDPVIAFSYPKYNRDESRGAYLWSVPQSLRAGTPNLSQRQIEALESVGYFFE